MRVYGSEGALIARLVEEFGVMETLKGAKPDAVEFVDVEVPERLFPPGGDVHEPWPSLYYSNLTANFVDEILGGRRQERGELRRCRLGAGGDQRRRAVAPRRAAGSELPLPR